MGATRNTSRIMSLGNSVPTHVGPPRTTTSLTTIRRRAGGTAAATPPAADAAATTADAAAGPDGPARARPPRPWRGSAGPAPSSSTRSSRPGRAARVFGRCGIAWTQPTAVGCLLTPVEESSSCKHQRVPVDESRPRGPPRTNTDKRGQMRTNAGKREQTRTNFFDGQDTVRECHCRVTNHSGRTNTSRT